MRNGVKLMAKLSAEKSTQRGGKGVKTIVVPLLVIHVLAVSQWPYSGSHLLSS